MKFSKHYAAAFSAFSLWGFFSLVLKPLAVYPSIDILFYRVFFSAAILLIFNFFFRRTAIKQSFDRYNQLTAVEKRRVILLTVVGGVLLIANWLSFIYVMNHVSINSASFAYLVCPILTMVLAYFILREKLGKWQWTAVAIGSFSCVLLSLNHFSTIFYSLTIALSYALYLVSQRKNNVLDKFTMLTFQVMIAALLLLPFFPSYASPLPSDPGFYFVLLIVALVFTIIPLYLNLYALKGVSSSTMGILLYIHPLFNFLIAIFYYKESISLLQYLAYFLIIVSICVFNLKDQNATLPNPAASAA